MAMKNYAQLKEDARTNEELLKKLKEADQKARKTGVIRRGSVIDLRGDGAGERQEVGVGRIDDILTHILDIEAQKIGGIPL